MKTIIVLLLVFIGCHLFGNEVYFFVLPENVEAVIGNTDLIITDQINTDNSSSTPGITNVQETIEGKSGIFNNLSGGFDTTITAKNLHLKLPLSYRISNFKGSVSIPFYFKREMQYSSVKKSTSGLGDIVISASYTNFFPNIHNETILTAKLATGNADKTVDGYLVPLGTGSTDFVLNNQLNYIKSNYSIYNNLSYRFNTAADRTIKIIHSDDPNDFLGTETRTYTVTNGSLLAMNSSFTYRIMKNLALIGGLSLAINGEGNQDISSKYSGAKSDEKLNGLSAQQDFTFIDILPAVNYTIWRIDFILGAKIPVVTQRNDNNTERDRSGEIVLRLSRNLF